MRRESIIPRAIGWTVEPPGEHTTTPATASSAPRRGLDGLAKPRACFTAHIEPAGAPAPAVACDTAAMNETEMLLVDDDRTVLDASGTVIDSEDFEAASQTVTGCRRVSQLPVDTPQKRLSRLSAKTANAEDLMNQENAFPLGNAPFEDERSIVIELEAHDMSRFE